MIRRVPTVVAALAVLLSTAAVAAAQPTASISGQTATFSDQGPSANADAVSVTFGPGAAPNTTDYVFTDNAPIAPGPGCLQRDPAKQNVITCTVPGAGTGVSVDVGGAPGSASQVVTLSGGNWAGQKNTITGGPGGDALKGAGGDDTFRSSAGPDEYDGGSGGSDTVDYSSETAAVHAQLDDSPDSGAGCPATCDGDTIDSLSIDNLIGGSGDDVLTGDGDDNGLTGGAGKDTLVGGAGKDTLTGGAGDDTLVGGIGDDTLVGGGDAGDTADYSQDGRQTGVDVDLARASSAPRAGAPGTERIRGNSVDEDVLTGILVVIGTNSDDLITGDKNANRLAGLGGNDTFKGESDDGTAAAGVAGDDVSGGDGSDTFSYADGKHTAGVTASLDDQANDGLADTSGGSPTGATPEKDNIRSDVENLTGTAGDDTLIGSGAANLLDGGSGGNDTGSYAGRKTAVVAAVDQTSGQDGDTFKNIENLTGGDGNDTLIGNAGANTLRGGPGDDTLRGGLGVDDLFGDAGSDIADYSSDTRARGVDVDLSAGTQKQHGDSTVEDTLEPDMEGARGTQFADVLSGGNGNDRLYGLAGADTLTGRVGDDLLDPGTALDGGPDAADTVRGNIGADTVTYADRNAANPVTVTPDNTADDGGPGEKDNVLPDVENVIGGSGNDTISADASPAHLVVANVFDGGAGDDTLVGRAGNDTLIGGLGSDTVSGDDGDDTLKLVDGPPNQDIGNCGAGKDSVEADQDLDTINADCETVKRVVLPPPGSGDSSNDPSVITIDNPSVTEGNSGTTALVFTVRLSKAQAAAVSVPFATADRSAKAGEDYAAQTGTVAFAAGETVKTISVVVNGDKSIEGSEQLAVGLGTPTGNAKLGDPATGVGTILDDDAPKLRKRTPGLSLVVAPRRDRTRPYRFVATGKLKRPKGVSAGRGCTGKVRVTATRGKKTVGRKTGFVDNTCTYTVPVAIERGTRRGTLRFQARFLGNKALKAKSSKTKTARAG